jgi:hypothetical protein
MVEKYAQSLWTKFWFSPIAPQCSSTRLWITQNLVEDSFLNILNNFEVKRTLFAEARKIIPRWWFLPKKSIIDLPWAKKSLQYLGFILFRAIDKAYFEKKEYRYRSRHFVPAFDHFLPKFAQTEQIFFNHKLSTLSDSTCWIKFFLPSLVSFFCSKDILKLVILMSEFTTVTSITGKRRPGRK